MVYAPQSQSGNFFNRQERNVHSVQLVEALTYAKEKWGGDHMFKVGVDLQHSGFDGENFSHDVEVRRIDNSLAERTSYSPALTNPAVSGTEFAMFVQDRWRVNDRLAFELGFRSDRDDVVETVNYSPRAGMSFSVLPNGRGILRGGFGKFAERTPLAVGAFTQYDVQTVTRFAADGQPLGPAVTFAHTIGSTVQDTREHRPDGRVGRAVRPPLLSQGGLPPPERVARLHRRSGSDTRAADTLVGGEVQVLGIRDDGPVPGERTS